jgi:putative adhesin
MSNKTVKWAKGSGQALMVLLLFSEAALAGGAAIFEKSFVTSRDPRISLTNLAGRVTVKGWDKAQVHALFVTVSPRVEVDTEVLPQTGTADKIRFSTHVLDPLVPMNEQLADYTLDVPVGSSLEIRSPQGSVQIENLQGDATVESVGANVRVTDFTGHLSVRSVGGNIEIIRPSGHVEADSITGNLHFVSPTTTQLRATTTSGRILYEGDFIGGGNYRLSAYSGNVDVICPASASFELRAKSERGKVQSELPIVSRRHSPSPAYANSLLGTHNTGKATVELTSFKGMIRVRPQ